MTIPRHLSDAVAELRTNGYLSDATLYSLSHDELIFVLQQAGVANE